MDQPHPSRNASTLIFRSKLETVNPAAIAFDPVTAKIGAVTQLQHRTGTLVPYDVSPDGRWLALASVLDRQQDIFIMHPDGSGLTRLTDDAARDWGPRFTPDGSAVTFYSNLKGKYDAWSIRLDGSARTQLSDLGAGVVFPMFAPDGKRLAMAALPRNAYIGHAPWPVTAATATALRGLSMGGGEFTPTYWSRGGRWLSGYVVDSAGEITGFGVLDPVAGEGHRLNDDSHGYDLAWLPDQKRVAYFNSRDELVVQDVETLVRRKATGTLPYPPETFSALSASPDGRTLYYGARQTQSNIWLVRRAAPAKR
jgi:Tol biopolymer transport system component